MVERAVNTFFDGESCEGRDELWAEIEFDVLSTAHSEWEAINAVFNFKFSWPQHSPDPEWRFNLGDYWDSDPKEYTYRFIWCCYALVWAIQQYDTYNESNKNRTKTE